MFSSTSSRLSLFFGVINVTTTAQTKLMTNAGITGLPNFADHSGVKMIANDVELPATNAAIQPCQLKRCQIYPITRSHTGLT